MSYKLSDTLIGHEADVRGVTASVYPQGGIITVSRDLSCRVWCKDEQSTSFSQERIYYGHSRYVAAVASMPPSDKYPQGLIVTGGHDNIILVFDYNSTEPIYKLEGHQQSVCTLDVGNFGTISSGSWDKTAKVWMNGKCAMSLEDHEAAVWSVKMMPEQGLMLTGSADKSIKLWKAGKCERTYLGHKDCVRGLAILSSNEFLSCSNDGTIRRWTLAGDCVQVYQSHTNFVYSISVIPGTNSFISSGEDRSVKIWKDDNCVQTITLPCQSVWSVAALQNGDIVAASSDGVARVFSCDETRQASEEKQKEFEGMVGNQAIPAAANLDLGEIKIDQLPGPEVLLVPGTKADQTKLIKRNGIVEAHQWNATDGKWQKIGEVTGAAGEDGAKRTSGKEMYEGKEYDHVFNVDIEEGKPPLKLPFNLTDDPWMAAQKFLDKNEISQMFLDQVANFIIKNTKGVTIGEPTNVSSDPFTGGGRYIPGGSAASNQTSNGADPFTGAGRYVPGGAPSTTTTSTTDPFTGSGRYVPNGSVQPNILSSKKYFPEKTYLKFAAGKLQPIITKLKEFNLTVEQVLQLTAENIQFISDGLDKLLKGGINLSEDIYTHLLSSMQKLSNWPQDKRLPALDIIRLILLDGKLSNDIYDVTHSEQFIDNLTSIIRNVDPASHSLLVFRIFSNSYLHLKGALTVYKHREKILECCEKCASLQNKNLNIAISTYLVNTSVYCRNSSGNFEDRIQICNLLCKLLSTVKEDEAIFRLLVSLGTLLFENDDLIAFAQSLDVIGSMETLVKTNSMQKVKDCAQEVLSLLTT